jgi:hypothetical protein
VTVCRPLHIVPPAARARATAAARPHPHPGQRPVRGPLGPSPSLSLSHAHQRWPRRVAHPRPPTPAHQRPIHRPTAGRGQRGMPQHCSNLARWVSGHAASLLAPALRSQPHGRSGAPDAPPASCAETPHGRRARCGQHAARCRVPHSRHPVAPPGPGECRDGGRYASPRLPGRAAWNRPQGKTRGCRSSLSLGRFHLYVLVGRGV